MKKDPEPTKGSTMSVVIHQQPMCVSNKTYIGILAGAYRVSDGVVRHAHGKQKGQIVEHLKAANINDTGQVKKALQQGAAMGGKVIDAAKKADSRLLIAAGVAAVAVTAGATVFYVASGKEPKDVRSFRKSLSAYVKAAEKGEITLKEIIGLEKSLEKLMKRKDFDEICELLDNQGLPALAASLIQHTTQLTRDNSNIIDFEVARKLVSTGTPHQDVRNCLEVQRMLFERAAS